MSVYGIVVSVVESLALLLLIASFVKPKRAENVMLTHAVLFTTYLILVVALSYFYVSIFARIALLSTFALMMVFLLYDGSYGSKVLPILLFYATVIAMQATVGFFVGNALGTPIGLEDNTLPVAVIGILSAVLLLLFASVVYFVRKKGEIVLSRSFIMMSNIVIVSQLLQMLLVVLVNYDEQEYVIRLETLNYLVSIGALIILISTIGLYSFIRNIQQDRILAMTERKIYGFQLTHYDDLREQILQYHIYRHNKVHFLQLAEGLLQSEQYEELEALLTKEIDDLAAYEKQTFTGYALLDIILGQKKRRAENKNISIRLSVGAALPDRIDEIEICMVLGNALDNAIEACEKVETEGRWIHLKMGQVQQMFIISVKNPFVGQVQQKHGKFLTTKADTAAIHGIGLTSIRTCIEKYGGHVTIDTSDNIFQIIASLPLE